ncbi:hypothetical protein LPJ72_002363 [Coemansia sp. Benny D160-2]|nr:hypothetical protein LPJ72_002363 [Coemansia sp. Benny D160-2]
MATATLASSKREVSVKSLKEYATERSSSSSGSNTGNNSSSYARLPTAVYRRVADYSDTRGRRRLAQVSQSWRALVAPLLWETVYVYDYADTTSAAQHIHKHYKQHVRHLHLQARHSRREVPRWLDSPAEVAIIGAWLEVPWPAVQSLSVRFLFTPVDVRIIDLPRNMPAVRSVVVDNSHIAWRDVAKWALGAEHVNDLSVSYADDAGGAGEPDRRRFAHLLDDYNVLQGVAGADGAKPNGAGFVRLRLQYQPDELGVFYASVLRTQPQLRELRIDRIPPAHAELLARQLSFPSALETLCLGMETSEALAPLSCLNPRSLPRLRRLMLRYNVAPLSQCQGALDEFTKHEWPRLQGLIVSVLTNDQCQRLVAACPNLQVLMVQPEAPAEHQIHNSGLESLLKTQRGLRRLHLVQQVSPIGEMLTDSFVWRATRFEAPSMFSLRRSRRWESWAPKLASSPWACGGLHDLSLGGVYLSFPALIQLMATLPQLLALKVSIRAAAVGTVVTARMFEPWGRHCRLRALTIDDIHDADIARLRQLCEHMPSIRHCRVLSQSQSLSQNLSLGLGLSIKASTAPSLSETSSLATR